MLGIFKTHESIKTFEDILRDFQHDLASIKEDNRVNANNIASIKEDVEGVKDDFDGLKYATTHFQKALDDVAKEAEEKLEKAVKAFTDATKDFVKQSEYQTLRAAAIGILVAIGGQVLAKVFLGGGF